jgi:ACS family pantothenate transporter-like MFS transporter
MELMALPDGGGCECSKVQLSEANHVRFIFNALMTVIVAAAGFFLVCFVHILGLSLTFQIPDAPGMAKVFWMSNEDDRISRWRLDRVKKMPPTVRTGWCGLLDWPADVQKLSWASVKRTFGGWQLYIFTLSYAFWAWATNSNTWIILFLVSNTSYSS